MLYPLPHGTMLFAMIALAWNRLSRSRGIMDGFGIGLAGLCLVHCLASVFFLGFLASVGSILLDPIIHEVGLVLAMAFGVLALGLGLREHGRLFPACFGGVGIGLMGGALTMPHGNGEILLTIAGVVLLAFGHYLNYRTAR